MDTFTNPHTGKPILPRIYPENFRSIRLVPTEILPPCLEPKNVGYSLLISAHS